MGLYVKRGGKKRRLYKTLALILLMAALGCGIYYVATEYSITAIEVKGESTYTKEQIVEKIKERDYVPNTLVMIAQNKIFGQKYMAFADEITMSYDDPHVLKVKVKEKLRAGMLEYMDMMFYFDSEGMALESRSDKMDGVPLVTGVKLKKVSVDSKIDTEGDYFSTIMSITKMISTYGLDVSEIHFDGEDDITLTAGKYKICLGSADNLEGKMSKITQMIDALSQEHKEGVIDMRLYTDEKNIITYHK